MPYNLIDEPWIPVRRASGAEEWIRPWEVPARGEDTSRATGLSAPRPDFNGALIQFLIGLVQTAFAPNTEREWRRRLQNPPNPGELREAFSAHASAFNLDGDRPRFLQDYDRIPEAKDKPIAYLLVDSPSDNALRKNKDHFIKDRTAQQYCGACTATALYDLQTHAPQGGRGHRTSLRGGGPVSTIVMGRDLWHTIWLNVLPGPDLAGGDAAPDGDPPQSSVYPWLAPTRTSGDDRATTPEDAHPLQAFWGMPRRIYLDEPEEGGRCSLCGREQGRLFSGYRTTNHGVDYQGAWEHPLTPHRIGDDGEPRPRHAQQEGFSYRYWRGFAIGGGDQSQPARVVRRFYKRGRYAELDDVFKGPARLWVFGFETDRTKIRAWHESQMPLYRVPPEVRPELERLVSRLVDVAGSVAGNLTQALRKGLYGYPSETTTGKTDWDIAEGASRDHTLFENAEVQFWQDTEPAFYDTLGSAVRKLEDREPESGEEALDGLKVRWAETLQEEALRLFDETTQHGRSQAEDLKALSVARQELRRFSSPQASNIQEALDLPDPEAAPA